MPAAGPRSCVMTASLMIAVATTACPAWRCSISLSVMVITVVGGRSVGRGWGRPPGQACSSGKSRRAISITKAEGPKDIQYPFLVSYPGPTIMVTVDSARVSAT